MYLGYTVIAAVFYSVGIPLFFVYLVHRFKHIGKGGDKVVEGALGWMYEPYRPGKEWWLGAE